MLLTDLRQSVRSMLANPGFAMAAILTIALGVGVNTLMFSTSYAVLFRAMPHVRDVDHLVWVSPRWMLGGPQNSSYPDYLDIREAGSRAFASMTAFASAPVHVALPQPERVEAQMVTASFFQTLGVTPHIGQFFPASADEGRESSVVLGYAYWRARFGGDESVVGRSILIRGRPFTIVGVAPREFVGPDIGSNPQLWLPLAMRNQVTGDGDLLHQRDAGWLSIMGRLNGGVSKPKATAALSGVVRTIQSARGEKENRLTLTLQTAGGGMDPENRTDAAVLLGLMMLAVLLVLLIACANLANLFLARAVARWRDTSVRVALGASRFQLVCHASAEALLLAVLGGAAALILAWWCSDVVVDMTGAPPALGMNSLQVPVLFFAFGSALLTSILAAALPSLFTSRPAVADALRASAATTPRMQVQSLLVSAQVALCVVLIATDGMFVSSVHKTLDADPGFDARALSTVAVDLQTQGYSYARARAFEASLLNEVRAVRGVRAAAIVTTVPMSGVMTGTVVTVPGDASIEETPVFFNDVSPGYLQTLSIKLAGGRDFTENDNPSSPSVVILDETLAHRLFPRDAALGAAILIAGDSVPREVVGIATNAIYDKLGEAQRGHMYLPRAQAHLRMSTVLVRSTRPDVLSEVTKVIERLDPQLPTYDAHAMSTVLRDRIDKERGLVKILSATGLLASVLAAIGLYGVTAYVVARRTREIGTRLALGASVRDILTLIVGDGARLIAGGAIAGILLAVPIMLLLSHSLYGVSPADPLTLVIVVGVLAIIALASSFLPAVRAARVDPMQALRVD